MVPAKRLSLTLILSLVCPALLASEAAGRQGAEGQPYEPRRATHQSWRIKSLLGDAGLTGRFVFFVDFDRDGNPWIASAEGLYFYDGYTWTRFSQEDGLPSNFVRCVRFARDGTLWIGTNRGVAIRDKEGRISRPDTSGLAGPNVRRIIEDDDGTLWFCSDTWLTPNVQAGLASYRDGRWTVYRQDDGLPSDYVSDYFRDSTGRQFVLTREGLGVNEGSGWTRPLEAGGFAGSKDYFWSIVESPSFGVIVTTETGIYILKDGKWSRIEHNRSEFVHLKLATVGSGEVIGLSSIYHAPKQFMGWNGADFVGLTESIHVPGEATYVTEAPDGSVWCAGYDLLLRWERSGGEWTEYPDISAPVLADRQGRIWFTDGQEILRLTADDKWESLPYAVGTIKPGRDTEVLAFSATAVIRFTSDKVITYGPEQTGMQNITGHTLDSRGFSWLHGLDQNGHNAVSVFDGMSWAVQAPLEIQGGDFWGSAPDPSTGIYYLISEGANEHPHLVYIDRDGVSEIDLPDMASGYTPRLHVDYQGSPWVYGHFGLLTRTDGVWSRIEEIPGEKVSGAVNSLGETWFAYDGTAGGAIGVGRLRNAEWSYFDLDKRPHVCGRNPDGAVFFGTTGALHIGADGPGEALSRLALPVQRTIFNAVRSPTGDVWIGLGDSVLRYRADRVPPQTLIVGAENEVRQGDSLAVTFQGVERFKPHGEGTFTYSWRIGSGPWTDFGPAPTEGLALSLGPGRYALEVRARDEGHDIDPTPARTEFRVAAIPWPQRPWFWPVIGAVFTGLALLGCAALMARNRARFHATELERVVKERTAKLSESEARFRAMTAAAPLPFVITRESDGVILYANPLLGETLGIPNDELLGRRVQEFFGPPSKRRRLFAEVQRSGYVQGHEVLTKKADGTPIWCLVSLQKMIYEGQPALIGGFHDITERKHTAEELKRARTTAEAANRAKSVFLANLTHEVRTPIMAMLSAAETAAETPYAPGDRLNYAEIISRNGRHLLSLFDNLLDFARMDTDKFTIRPVRCPLSAVRCWRS